jgi:hypothetical protein
VFTGACTLWKKCAAFESTEFRQLVASKFKTEKVEDNMNEEQMKTLLAGLLDNFKTELAGVKESMDTMVTEVKAEVDKANKQVEDLAVALAETKDEIKASKEPVAPAEPPVVQAAVEPKVEPPVPAVIAAGQTVVSNGDFEKQKVDIEKKRMEINASNMSPLDKCKAITKLRFENQEK